MEPQNAIEILCQLKQHYLEQIAIAEEVIKQAQEGIKHVDALTEGVDRLSMMKKSIQKNPRSSQQ